MPFDNPREPEDNDPQLILLRELRNQFDSPDTWCAGEWRNGSRRCVVSALRDTRRLIGADWRTYRAAMRTLVRCVPRGGECPLWIMVRNVIAQLDPRYCLITFNDLHAKSRYGILCLIDRAIEHRKQELHYAI